MHVPDGFMNVTMSAATGVISFGTLWAYIRSAKDLVADKFIALTGMMSALIFVLQMINFPIAAGTSGHLLGGALAVIVLGPRLGLICLSVVVIIQSLLFADGGLSALGVNVLNMAIVTSATSWFIVKYWIKFIGKNKTSIVSVSVLAGILSVVFSSIAFTIQYAIGGTISIPVGTVLLAMVTTHFIIGFGEGIITALIITLLIRVRPDLIYAYERSDENTTKVSFYGLFIILILLLSLVTPFASSSPDGLESVAEEFGFTQTDGIVLLLDDYGISAVNNDFISTVLSALLGVIVLAIMFNLIISRRKSGKNS
ncbi:MAG: energy-coupling factor ABC transporter permease [Actinomycetota bacterium]|nr:energy-coupling factor ABC transporter permease [Actinomycetota bacterium]MDA3008707.1 energy-coupling factor ABC transporter permease [Actinomycetota bacterium]MDA3037751.1 energy-coupling factor ABC transporter permease [Actinomycetota bacterium]